jgi:Fic family protein
VSKKPYRVEVNYPRSGKPKYYLVRDVKVGTSRTKVRRYLGTEPPSPTEVDRFRSEYGPSLELQAASRKARYSSEFYKSEYLDAEALYTAERVKMLYAAVLGLLTVSETEAYERDFEITYIHGTTAIEGNTLTLSQAQDLLSHDITPKGKSLREINEVQNFKKVVRYRNSYRGRVTPDFIRNVHALVMDNIDLESAGQFRRRDDIGIEGCPIPVTPAKQIDQELRALVNHYYDRIDKGSHPFEECILFHYRIEMIHPFTDGNGRVGREVLNFMLTRARFPRLLFLGKDRPKYIGALKLGNAKHYGPMVLDFLELLFSQRLAILERRLGEVAALRRRKTGQLRLTDFVTS